MKTRLASVGVVLAVGVAGAVPLVAQLEVPTGSQAVELGRLSDRIAFEVDHPIYRLGWAGEHDFVSIVSGVLLPDGGAAVLDVGAHQLVVIDAEGSVRELLGGQGEGPGEFMWATSVTRKGLDTLVVEDDGNGRLNYFVDGDLVRDERYSETEMINGYGLGRWHDGSAFWIRWATPSPLPDDWTHDAVLWSSSAVSALDTALTYRSFSSPGPSMANPFRTNGKLGLTEGAIVTAWGNEPQFVRWPLDGSSPLHVRWEEASPALTDSLWAEHLAYERGRGKNPELRIGRRAAVDGPLPLIGELRGDSEGRVWVSRWGPADSYRNGTAGPYRVFGPDGSWQGWVELPGRLRVLDIRSDRLLAVQRDDFDVEAIVILPLRRVTSR